MINKKILHLTHTDIATDARVLKEMKTLSEAGFEISGLGIDIEEGAAKSDITFNSYIDGIYLHSRQFRFLPKLIRHILSLCEITYKILPRAIRIRPNIVHCHDTLVLPLGVIIKLLTRATLIYDAHELESDRNGLTKVQSLMTLWVEKFSWRFVDALIVVSPSIQRWYFDNLGPKSSAVILNSPMFEDLAVFDDKYLRQKFNIPNDRLIFIYVGILGAGRGLDLVIEAFLRSDIDSHVVFLGFGDLYDDLVRLSQSSAKFHVHPAVPHSEVVPIVRSADFGLCLVENISLSDYFCLPNKLFEYCFAGVPVLASNFPDISSVVYKYGIGRCCDLQPAAIAEAVKELEGGECNFSFHNLCDLNCRSQEVKLLELYEKLS